METKPEYGGLFQYSILCTDALIENKNFEITIKTSNEYVFKKYRGQTKVIYKKKFYRDFIEFLFNYKLIKILAYRAIMLLKPILTIAYNLLKKKKKKKKITLISYFIHHKIFCMTKKIAKLK